MLFLSMDLMVTSFKWKGICDDIYFYIVYAWDEFREISKILFERATRIFYEKWLRGFSV